MPSMKKLLRTIHQAKWLTPDSDFEWIGDKDTLGDPIADFATKKGELSLWLVDEHEQNLERILAAVSCTRARLDKFDYALLDFDRVNLSFVVEQTPGTTGDAEADDTWHFAVRELTARKVANIVQVYRESGKIDRRFPKEIAAYVRKYADLGVLTVPKSIRDKL